MQARHLFLQAEIKSLPWRPSESILQCMKKNYMPLFRARNILISAQMPWNQKESFAALSVFCVDERKRFPSDCSERTMDTPPSSNTGKKNSRWQSKRKIWEANASISRTGGGLEKRGPIMMGTTGTEFRNSDWIKGIQYRDGSWKLCQAEKGISLLNIQNGHMP